MLKNIFLFLMFTLSTVGLSPFGSLSAQSQNDRILEPNQQAHSNCHTIAEAVLKLEVEAFKVKEQRFIHGYEYPNDLKQIFIYGQFLELYPTLEKDLVHSLALYWVWNRPWSLEDEDYKKAFLASGLVDEQGIINFDFACALFKYLTIYFMDDEVDFGIRDARDVLKEDPSLTMYTRDLTLQLEVNQKAHKAMLPKIMDAIQKNHESNFKNHVQEILSARQHPEDVDIIIDPGLTKLYPHFTQEELNEIAKYWVFNQPWSTLDTEIKRKLSQEKLVDNDGVIIDQNLLMFLFCTGITSRGYRLDDDLCPYAKAEIRDELSRQGVERKMAILEHCRKNPGDIEALKISSAFCSRSTLCGLDYNITQEDMIELFWLWLYPKRWTALSLQDKSRLLQTGWVNEEGIISDPDKYTFFLGFKIILKDHINNKFPKIPGYKPAKLIALAKIVKKNEEAQNSGDGEKSH